MLCITALIHDSLLHRAERMGGWSLLDESDLTRRETEVRRGEQMITSYLGTKQTAVIN